MHDEDMTIKRPQQSLMKFAKGRDRDYKTDESMMREFIYFFTWYTIWASYEEQILDERMSMKIDYFFHSCHVVILNFEKN